MNSFGDDAPQFFCAGIDSVAQEGPNLVMSFATPIPDKNDRKYLTNVRVVMSLDSTKQMIDCLQIFMNKPSTDQGHKIPYMTQ